MSVWHSANYLESILLFSKKAEKLAEVQAELISPDLKMLKPSDTRWLARERAVCAVQRTLPALVNTFEEIHEETGDAEADGIASLFDQVQHCALYLYAV